MKLYGFAAIIVVVHGTPKYFSQGFDEDILEHWPVRDLQLVKIHKN